MPNLRHHLRRVRFLLRQRAAGRFVFIHINKCGGTSVEAALGIPCKIHDTARARRLKIGRRRWEEAFTFALVRHPYARAISLYKFRVRTNQTGLGDKPIALNDWVRATFGEKDPAYYDKPLMFAPCFDWLSDGNGRIIVDHAAKLEAIDAEWPTIEARTGRTAALPVHNASGPGPAPEALDPTSRRIVQGHFQKDFEEFGYEP
jgi:chondroitin 4-sulfotransferase 11